MTTGQRRARLAARQFSPLAYKLADLANADWLECEREEAAKRASAAQVAQARAADEREEREWHAAAQADREESYTAFLRHWFPHIQTMMEEARA